MFSNHKSVNQLLFNLSFALIKGMRQYHDVMAEIGQMCPWEDDDYGRRSCFFCVNEDDEPHKDDCLWMRAVEFCKALGLDYYKES